MHLMWQGIYNKITSRYTHKETHWRKYMSMQLISAFNVARYLEKNLEVHMKMHNEEKPYQCIKCYTMKHTGENNIFTYKDSTGGRSYYCNLCKKILSHKKKTFSCIFLNLQY